MNGREAKFSLGLGDIKYVYLQQVLGVSSTPMYIVTYDSRYPKTYLSIIDVMDNPALLLAKIRSKGLFLRKIKVWSTPPQRFEHLDEFKPASNALYLFNDLAGKYLSKLKNFRENTEFNIKYL